MDIEPYPDEMFDEAQRREKTNEHPKIAEVDWIDDAFYVEETRFLWKSVRKDTGKDFLFGLTKEIVINMTRWHLKCEQDGTLEQYSRVVGSAIVDGKL
jgi:hypothetical protein